MAPKELPDTNNDTRAQAKLIEIRTIFVDILRYHRLSEAEKSKEDAEEAAVEQQFVRGIQTYAPMAIPRQSRPADTERIEAEVNRAEQLLQQNLKLQHEIEALRTRIKSMSVRW